MNAASCQYFLTTYFGDRDEFSEQSFSEVVDGIESRRVDVYRDGRRVAADLESNPMTSILSDQPWAASPADPFVIDNFEIRSISREEFEAAWRMQPPQPPAPELRFVYLDTPDFKNRCMVIVTREWEGVNLIHYDRSGIFVHFARTYGGRSGIVGSVKAKSYLDIVCECIEIAGGWRSEKYGSENMTRRGAAVSDSDRQLTGDHSRRPDHVSPELFLGWADDHDHEETFIEVFHDAQTVLLVTCNSCGTFAEFVASQDDVGLFRGSVHAEAFTAVLKQAITEVNEVRRFRYPDARV